MASRTPASAVNIRRSWPTNFKGDVAVDNDENVGTNTDFELAAPKTPAELKQMKADVARHTAPAIAALKTKRQDIIAGAKAAAAQAKIDIKQVDQDLKDLGAKREFKARGPRRPKQPAVEPAAAPAPKGAKKK